MPTTTGPAAESPRSHRSPSHRSRVTRVTGAAGLAAAVALALAGPAPAWATLRAPRGVVVAVRAGAHGQVLVTGTGRTLYTDRDDRPAHPACTGSCLVTWPPVLLPRGDTALSAGPGISGLGTIRRPGGRLQITWHGHPLYRYVGDTRAGQSRGQGSHGLFFVAELTPSHPGRAAIAPAATTPAASTAPAHDGAQGRSPASTAAAGPPTTGGSLAPEPTPVPTRAPTTPAPATLTPTTAPPNPVTPGPATTVPASAVAY